MSSKSKVKGENMKITKILVALAFLFSVSTANAGELSVTGSMEVTLSLIHI